VKFENTRTGGNFNECENRIEKAPKKGELERKPTKAGTNTISIGGGLPKSS